MSRKARKDQQVKASFWTPRFTAVLIMALVLGVAAIFWAKSGLEPPIQVPKNPRISAIETNPLPLVQSRHKELIAQAARAADIAKQAANKKSWDSAHKSLEPIVPLLEAAVQEVNSDAEKTALKACVREQLRLRTNVYGMEAEALLAKLFEEDADGRETFSKGIEVLRRAQPVAAKLSALDAKVGLVHTSKLDEIHSRFVKIALGKVVGNHDAARKAADKKDWQRAIAALEANELLLQAAVGEKISESQKAQVKYFLNKHFSLKATILGEQATDLLAKHPLEPEKDRRQALSNGIKILEQALEAASKIDPPDQTLTLLIKNGVAAFLVRFGADDKKYLVSSRRILRDIERVLENEPDNPETPDFVNRTVQLEDDIKFFEGRLKEAEDMLQAVQSRIREKPELDPKGLLMDLVKKNLAIVEENKDASPDKK